MISFCPLSGDYKNFSISVCNESADDVQSLIKFLIKLKEAGVKVGITDDEIMTYKLNRAVIAIEFK